MGEAAAAADLGSPRGAVYSISDHYDLVFEGALHVAYGVGFPGALVVWGPLPVVAKVVFAVVGGFYAYMHHGVLRQGWAARRGEVHVFERGLVVARRRGALSFRWDEVALDTFHDGETRTRVWRIERPDGKDLALYAPTGKSNPLSHVPLRHVLRTRLWSREQRAATAQQYADSAAALGRYVGGAVHREQAKAAQPPESTPDLVRAPHPPDTPAASDASGTGGTGDAAPGRPAGLRTAVALMGVGAALAVARVVVFLGQRGQIAKDQPRWTDEQVRRAHVTVVVLAVVVVGLWIWMAVKNAQGRRWALWTACALALLNGLTGIIRVRGGWTFAQNELAAEPVGEIGSLLQVIDLAGILLGIAIVLVLVEDGTEAHHRAAEQRRGRRLLHKVAPRGRGDEDERRPWPVLVASINLVATAVATVVLAFLDGGWVVGGVFACFWAWMAAKTAQGRAWARYTVSAVVALDVIVRVWDGLYEPSILAEEPSDPVRAVNTVYLALTVAAVVLLYLPASSRYVRATSYVLARSHAGLDTGPDRRRGAFEPHGTRPSAGALRRRLRPLWSRVDERLGSMSPRGFVLSVLTAVAVFLLLLYPISSLVPPLGRLVICLAGLVAGGAATLPFTRVLAQDWDDPLVIPPFRGWRSLLRVVAHLGAAVAVLVAAAQLIPSSDAVDEIKAFAVGIALGSTGTLWGIAILLLGDGPDHP